MTSWVDTGTLKKCPVYKINSNNSESFKFIVFGPDLSKFKQFTSIEELLEYAALNNLILDFKNDS